MSYTAPTTTTFKSRYPEFVNVAEATLDLILSESIAVVGETWLESDRAKAQTLLCAHTLTMEGEPDRSNADSTGVSSQVGAVTSIDIGGAVKMSFSDRAVSGSSGEAAEYNRTQYGARLLALMSRNFSGPVVV
jgi:hypothetical protein